MSDLLSLPLDQLEQPLKLRSRLLDAEIWLVPLGWDSRDLDGPVYTTEECKALLALDLSPAELKTVHRIKTLFDGDLELPEEPGDSRQLYQALLRRYRQLEKQLHDRSTPDEESELLRLAKQLSRLMPDAEATDYAPSTLSALDPESAQ